MNIPETNPEFERILWTPGLQVISPLSDIFRSMYVRSDMKYKRPVIFKTFSPVKNGDTRGLTLAVLIGGLTRCWEFSFHFTLNLFLLHSRKGSVDFWLLHAMIFVL